MMKEGMLAGLLIGMVAGALLFKHCGPCKDIVNQGEQFVKKEIENMTDNKKQK